MKRVTVVFVVMLSWCFFSLPAMAGMLNVPEDFPGQFRMDLLAWDLYVEDPNNLSLGGSVLDMVDNYIEFNASAFDNPSGSPTYGTSTLSVSATDFMIGSGTFFGAPVEFYINGAGTGTLVDNGDGTGDWTLTIPMYTIWNYNFIPMEDLTLSTIGSVTYYTDVYDPITNSYIQETTTGESMDYATGDAVLVGRSTATSGQFQGFSGTFVILGNDPIVAAVPEPSSLLLIVSGLVGLIQLKKKR